MQAASSVSCFQVNQVPRKAPRKTPSPNTPNLKTHLKPVISPPFPIHIHECPPGSKSPRPTLFQIRPAPPSLATSHQNGLSSPSCNYQPPWKRFSIFSASDSSFLTRSQPTAIWYSTFSQSNISTLKNWSCRSWAKASFLHLSTH